MSKSPGIFKLISLFLAERASGESERGQLEDALRKAQQRAQHYLSVANIMLLSLDAQGRVQLINPKGCEMLGYSEENILGKNWFDNFLPERGRKEVKEVFAQLMAGDIEPVEYHENQVLTASGEERHYAWHNSVLRDEAGNINGILSSAEDITERKLIEAEILQLNVNLEKKVEERTAQLKAINTELETFTYSVSHDLKAPLRTIDGYSRLLLEDHAAGLNPEGKTFLANIRKGAQQMSQLIEDLLAYSRLERRVMITDSVALEELVQSIVAEFAEEISRCHVKIKILIPNLEVDADFSGLSIILRNLLGNALKFTCSTAHPAIEIGGCEKSETCLLWVRDNGIGFDMKFHDRIFEIFQRLQRAEDYSGTGVGLAIVRKAAQRMGGSVWADSKPGEGASFYVELPK